MKLIKEAIKELAINTTKTKQSKFFKLYLNTMSKFWNYSHNNQLLINYQFPNATRIAGYQTWKKLKRKIKKSEKAIKILAPIVIDKEDKEKIYFKPVNVFDISQTEGKPLPEIDIDIKGNDKKEIFKQLLNFCQDKDINVKLKPISKKGLYGYSKGGSIVINNKKSLNTQVNTLLHEIAHELLHKDSQLSKQQKEIQAEAVAYVVGKCFGLKCKSFNYLALYGVDSKKIMENLEVVSKCVRDLIISLNIKQT